MLCYVFVLFAFLLRFSFGPLSGILHCAAQWLTALRTYEGVAQLESHPVHDSLWLIL